MQNRRNVLQILGAAAVAGSVAEAAPTRAKTLFGVNVYDLMLGGLQSGGRFGTDTIEILGRTGIPFIRFPAGAQWAGDWARFESDPAERWAGLDALFSAAEHSSLKLIPCLFWNAPALSFHCKESVAGWTNPRSRTRAFAKSYVEAFISRYDHSPALMMYEFANELNDWIDLPDVTKFWPKADPTMPSRKPVDQDRLTGVQLRGFVQDFARTIRQHSRKPISMGSNTPRGNAWHLARGRWDIDSRDQVIAQLRVITPPEVDALSIHLYEAMVGRRGAAFAALPDLLATFVAAARQDRRSTFIGEFGVPRIADRDAERRRFAAMVQAIGDAGIAYAALWNVSLHSFQPDFDVAPHNDRAYQLATLVAANGRR
jgi:hypothetical protein